MTSNCNHTKVLCSLCALLASACGNYSNDDVDFALEQEAMPEQGDIEVKLQVSVDQPNSAEYYKDTRSVVLTFNTMAGDLTGIIEGVRAYAPTSRSGDQRIWGPFPDDNHPGWEIRVVMRRSSASETLLHMDYWAQLRQVGQDDTGWVSLLVGQYTSQGGVRAGQGEIHFNVQDARLAGYPVDSDQGLRELDHIQVSYDNSGFPVQVTMEIVNLPTAKTQKADYLYQRQADDSGIMQFALQAMTDAGQVTATMTSRWRATGEGRADVVANTPNLQATLGTDCWGGDTVASYSYRLRDDVTLKTRNEGDPFSCVY